MTWATTTSENRCACGAAWCHAVSVALLSTRPVVAVAAPAAWVRRQDVVAVARNVKRRCSVLPTTVETRVPSRCASSAGSARPVATATTSA